MFLKLLKLNTIAAKISLIPAVGVSCFLVFLTTVTISGNDTVSKLSSLEDEFYPKLLISDSRITLLGKISESFVTAAITGDMDSVTKAETLYADIVEVNKKLSTLDPKNSVQHKEYTEKLEEYFALARWISKALLGESEGGKMPGAEDRKKMTSTLQELEAHYKTFRASAQKSLDSTINDAHASSNRVIKLGVLIGIVSIVLSVVATIPVNRTITSSLRRVTESLESFSSGNGDLTVRLPTANIKEIAQLSSAFNQFISKLNRTFSRVIELSSQLSSHAFEVSSAAEETSVISGIQSQNAKKAKENINGMMQEIDLISQNSVKAENYSNKSHNNAESGLGIFSNTVSQITNMKDSAKSAVDDMGNLLADVSRVTNILDVIQNITSQTNLLALNAAIEAARAGEKGRGFAVVADEVRVLATRTQESATDIQSMFENLQEGTKLVSNTLDGSREKAEASFSEMGKANDSLREITSDIASIQSVSTDIAEAALKQVEMTKVFSKTIEDMMVSSSENENASHELASVSSKLAELATELTSITSEFNV